MPRPIKQNNFNFASQGRQVLPFLFVPAGERAFFCLDLHQHHKAARNQALIFRIVCLSTEMSTANVDSFVRKPAQRHASMSPLSIFRLEWNGFHSPTT
jgi:hypothetical protein